MNPMLCSLIVLAYGRGVMAYFTPDGMMVGHSGSITGFSSIMLYDLNQKAFIVVMSNDRGSSADDIAVELLEAIREFR